MGIGKNSYQEYNKSNNYGLTAEELGDFVEIVVKDPYSLIDLYDLSFSEVDKLAKSRGISDSDKRRLCGATIWVLKEKSASGDMFVYLRDVINEIRDLFKRFSDINGFDDSTLNGINEIISDLVSERRVVFDSSNGSIYLPELYNFERGSASILLKHINASKIDVSLDDFFSRYEESNNVVLSVSQRGAIEKLINNRFLIITGLPGTGKTFLIKSFVYLFKSLGIHFSLMAPTGIAAKRLSLVTGFFAGTIHRILGYDGTSWGFNCDNKFSTNAVIIDEASMLSQELFYRILDALYDDTIIVLVGDDAQLPSVGSGNVLRELINCSVIPTVRLTQIFRQANESKIIVNAHRINSGMSLSPEVMDAKSDFCFVPLKENQDESEIIEWIVKAALILKGRNANFQVLSPMYKGVLGVDELNRHLREALNPLNDRKREVRIGNLIYRDGDRVMIVKNNYKLGVFNGDMGKILSVGYNEFLIKIHEIDSKISETIIRVPVKDIVTQISLAYAITVHKCQGNEFDTVIIPIVNSQKNMLQRNLFYTAVTRARSKVWVLGHASAVNRAISNNKVVFRNTGLSRALVSMFNSKSG